MEIVSKFVIGSDKGVSDFLNVKKLSFINLHKSFINEKEINSYIEEHFDERKTINELNNLSNQLIITYKENLAVAYCLIKSGSRHSLFPEEKRTTEIDIAILQEYDSEEIRTSLYTKFTSATKFADIIWISILQHNSLIEFLKSKGFELVRSNFSKEFKLPASIFCLELSNNN
ncbi:hypothetical protein [Chryseobacterium luquanense]|uniref:N-acetyltransferase domain-containing protein n=1 Tax=Chryseobacterium luquanense TaxID=2983766 RepID=A0ABT3Y7E6_9FLAO|nr:hypothetical protein [Chryseobacterium luquanense]MCX8534088.1 hypothetical protein [Chryseobacterium luquanense]